ncbi:MAG: HemY protein [Cryomorphaceae bacterium]|jgi:HemY protein
MRYVILLLLASVFGYGALQIGRIDPDNYVKMYIGNYVIEIKVLGFILLVIGIVVVLYFLLRLIRMLWEAPKSYNRWRQRLDVAAADADLGAGYLALIKGDWKQAEKKLVAKSAHSSIPYLNFLAAAQAAQEQGKIDMRDEYLNAAYKAAPKERLAIGLTKARLHQSAGQLDQALATLKDVADIGAKNSQFTAMLMQTYEQLEDWQGAQALLPSARKQAALPDAVLDTIYNQIHVSQLSAAQDITAGWNALPRDQKKRQDNILIYARHLIKNGESTDAEKLLRSSLKSAWSDELVRLYGKLPSDKPVKLRRRAEGWLLARPENAELNLAAGRLAVTEKNLDLAKEYLQKAIQLEQLPKAYSLLGEVYEASNDSGKALQLYRAGMLSLSSSAKLERISDSDAGFNSKKPLPVPSDGAIS